MSFHRLAAAATLLVAGCATGEDPEPATHVDIAFFECQVQPILDRSCAFVACHGDPARPFFVYSMSKTRLAGDDLLGEVLTDKELCANFYRARALAVVPAAESQLITKPTTLDGLYSQYHEGNYLFEPDGPEVRCLTAWMAGALAPEELAPAPEECQLPWRVDGAGRQPSCQPRRLDCEAALRGPDLPESGS
ncbi:MAG: hypothetical protein KC933_17765 [Myxococcales bacterium]|nr:hypothetical protein [Myxococcales bacterium]MCB9648997.1 hypothetical protein [Deltaproteobacteria bacterium]